MASSSRTNALERLSARGGEATAKPRANRGCAVWTRPARAAGAGPGLQLDAGSGLLACGAWMLRTAVAVVVRLRSGGGGARGL